MTRDQFEQVKALANRLIGEIEWADFPTLPLVSQGQWITLLRDMLADAQFTLLLNRRLCEALTTLEQLYQQAEDETDPLRASLALIFTGLRGTLAELFPESRTMDAFLLRAKFKSMMEPMVHGPPPPVARQKKNGRRLP